MKITIIENKFQCEYAYNSDSRESYLSYIAEGKALVDGEVVEYDCGFDGLLPTEFYRGEADMDIFKSASKESSEYKEAIGIISAIIDKGFFEFAKSSEEEALVEGGCTKEDIYPSRVLSYSQALNSGFIYKDYETVGVPENFIGVIEYRVWGRSAYIGLYILSESGERYRLTAYKDRGTGEILAPGGLSIRYGVQNGVNYRFTTGLTRNKTTKFKGMELVETLPLGLVLGHSA